MAVNHRIGSDIDGSLFCYCGEWDERDGERFEDHLHAVHIADFTEHEAEVHEQLMRGATPCRFCGVEWLQDGGLRHDPLKMAGEHTPEGRRLHWHRGNVVAFGRLARAIYESPTMRRFSRWINGEST